MAADPLLDRARELAGAWLAGLAERPVGPRGDAVGLTGPLPAGEDPAAVLEALASGADPGLAASPGPRYFGFVTGGSLPVALAADWLTSAWDQNACLHVMSPAAAAAEAAACGWARELLGLPAGTSAGLVTGAQMANVTALAAARHAILARVGWDVEERGLQGAPHVRVLAGEEAHVTVFNALRLLGLGEATAELVPADDQGRMRADALAAALAGAGGRPAGGRAEPPGGGPAGGRADPPAALPTIVCAQAGNVNTGAFDPLEDVVAACRAHGAWCHVDGAFGLWAAAAPARAHLVAGAAGADSWAVDAHKWLNVPYDGAFAFTADPEAHRAAMRLTAAYLTEAGPAERNGADWAPEASRRARAFPIWAALRHLGRDGVAELVERCCALAARMAARLAAEPRIAILNEVVLNQVLVRVDDDDAATDAAVARVQADGTCWLGGTRRRGRAAMRISVSGWATTEADIDRSAEVIAAAVR
jgi:glutamate/tyrosine decarboxylase-like PLP-dependent enzyme